MKRLLLVLACAALLAACSAIKLGYNNADTALLWQLDSYLDLNAEQEALARERVGALLAWHRATQLRDYAQFIVDTRARLDGPVQPASLLEVNAAITARMLALGDRAAPDLARLALTLTPAQLDHFARKLADDNSRLRKENASAGRAALDARVKRFAEGADFWFGRLNPQQLELVRASLAARPAGTDGWTQERERRQQVLLGLLRRMQAERPDEATAAAWLRGYFAELARPPSPELRERVEANRADNAALIAQLINAASPEQKAALQKKLAGFADDFVALAGQRG